MRKIILFIMVVLFVQSYSAQSLGGTLSSNTVVCAGSNAGILSVSGYSGSIVRWEYSYSTGGPWTPLIVFSNTYNYLNLIQSTYFRVIVLSPGYPEANSNFVLVDCDLPTVAGTVNTNTLQCINLPVTTSLSANTGSVLAWEYSVNNWISSNTITTTNTLSATLSALTTTTQIRAQVKNGVCLTLFTNSITVVPAPLSFGGSIAGIQTVCATANAATLTVTGYTGSILQWESAQSSGGPYSPIASSSNTNATGFFNLTQDTWYRVLVKNSTCPAINSNAFKVQVDQPSVGGSIIGTQSVCAVVNTGTLQVLGNTGLINQWEFSTNNGLSWSSISNTTSIYIFSNISTSRFYRAQVQNGSCAATNSGTFILNVSPLPLTNFSLVNVCQHSPITFTNSTTGAITHYWSFGDNINATGFNSSHTYSAAGTYTVKLISTSAQNCSDSIIKTIIIYPKPTASFFSADTACFGSSMQFVNTSNISSGSISLFKFNFGDGSPQYSISPLSHIFSVPGTYTISLISTSNFNCSDTSSKIINVFPKPVSNFHSSNTCKGSISSFTNLSTLSNGNFQSHWNFGNASSSNQSSPSYTYPLAGPYVVSLIVISNHNCSDTSFKNIHINERPTVVFNAANVCLGNSTSFITTFSPALVMQNINILFGDASYTTALNPTHKYVSPGNFTASLTASTDSGCVVTAVKSLSVYDKPKASFTFNNACVGDTIPFSNLSSISSGTLSSSWGINGMVFTQPQARYKFVLAGTYSISLIVSSNFNCVDTSIKTILIYEAPKTAFNFTNVCDGKPINFVNSSGIGQGIISEYKWSFGDNTGSAEINPIKQYLNAGAYTVTLISRSSNGCTDTLKKTLEVYELPLANFSLKNACINTPFSFQNTSHLNSGNYHAFWQFGDADTSLAISPQHLYKKSGTYNVYLKLTSNQGCVDSIYKTLQVFALPKVYAGNDTIMDKGFPIRLNASGALTYNWWPPIGLNNPFISNPLANPDSSSTYIVEGTDEQGCKNSDTLVVSLNPEIRLIPFNVVTPDKNGLNDTWQIKNIESFKNNHVIIFDQWNQKVYEKQSYANDWEGKNQRGEILPDATYYYILTITDLNKKYTGFITLMRNKD